MNKRKMTLSIVIALLLSAFVIGAVIAGSSLDYGYVETQPPVGEVNWTAWFNNAANTLAGGMPREVMTEDGTNISSGVDQGYQLLNDTPAWYLQATNLEFGKGDGEPISMIFGGLGASSGKLWFYDFDWDGVNGFTWHGTVPLSTQTEACPAITDMVYSGSTKTVTFAHLADSTYHVYRSRNGSGAGNQASNGRYLYLLTTTTNSAGIGTFTDESELESWYIVIRANPTTNELVGCHSEEAFPTNVLMGLFEAEYDSVKDAVVLTWETVNENNIAGFNILRSTSETGTREQINDGMIPATYPGQNVGDSYSYDDTDVDAGATYYYWIEVVGLSGGKNTVGPRSATVPGPATFYWYYLPLILN